MILEPEALAFAQLAADLLEASGILDAEPGSMSTEAITEGGLPGLAVFVVRAGRGWQRIGVIPESTLAARAAAIRRARN